MGFWSTVRNTRFLHSKTVAMGRGERLFYKGLPSTAGIPTPELVHIEKKLGDGKFYAAPDATDSHFDSWNVLPKWFVGKGDAFCRNSWFRGKWAVDKKFKKAPLGLTPLNLTGPMPVKVGECPELKPYWNA
eukprot:NODE_4054_length_499_cov_550.975556_g3459_i0.p1 GENE.NODE_4054_length_499_cov_550.975556_g3459_i0~~NODE_4054_length_499_cov_550.975556_g3459_i0.p1  ORF type:complete len:131 (-),score=17.17 NODE_4054_length_499_cov_550.975556_g3459_i0:77-469(-)